MKNQKILILPGWGSNSLRWKKVKEILEKFNFEVFVLDFPGFNLIPPPKNVWGQKDFLNWIFKKIEEKKWEKFSILGHSFGGSLAIKIAAQNPKFLEKLILISPPIKRAKSLKVFVFYFLAFFGKKIFSLPILKNFFPFIKKLFYFFVGTKDYYLAAEIMKETLKKIVKEREIEFKNGTLERELKKIEVPTLILWGKKDSTVPLKDAFFIKEKIKNCQLKIFPKFDHNLHQEAPEKLAKFVFQFLKFQ